MKKLYFLLLINIITLEISSHPKQVVILRHAERDKTPPVENQYLMLNSQGEKRAEALSKYFKTQPEFLAGPIDAIFATTPRSLQTIRPTSVELKLPIQTFFAYNMEEIKVANELTVNEIMKPKYDGKIVIICWEHLNIPILANLLGFTNELTWNDDVYDDFYILNYKQDGSLDPKIIKQNLNLN